MWVIATVSVSAMLLGAVLVFREFFRGGDISLQEFLITLALAVSLVWFLLTYSTLKVRVDAEGMAMSSFWGKKELRWKEIHTISVMPGYGYIPFIGYNVLIHTKKSRRAVALSTITFGNSHRLMKAIIEASFQANRNIRIKGSLLDIYGLPPYGIFHVKRC